VSAQFVGLQYNDDLNTNFIPAATLSDAGYDASASPVGLPGYTVVDLTVSRNLGRSIQAFFGAQNLFDVFPDRNSTVNSFNGIETFPRQSPFGMNGRTVYARVGVTLR